MGRNLVFAKTPLGEEAVRTRSRRVSRKLRNVLIVVDGRSSVEQLGARIGDPELVEAALETLLRGGFIRREEPVVAPAPPADIDSAAAGGEGAEAAAASPADEAIVAPRADAVVAGDGAEAADPEPVTIGPIRRGPRRNRSLVRGVAVAVAVMLLLAVAVVLAFPFGRFRADIEAAATRALGRPVTIAEVHGRFAPGPALVLEKVRIGDGADFAIDEIRLFPQIASLLFGRPAFREVTIVGVRLPVLAAFGAFSELQRLAASGEFEVRRVAIREMRIEAGELLLAECSGEMSPGGEGRPAELTLRDAAGSVRLRLAAGEPALNVGLEATNWKAGEASPLLWDALSLEGTLSAAGFEAHRFDGRTLDGNVSGRLRLDWGRGLELRAELVAERLAARRVAEALGAGPLVDGELGGRLRVLGSAEDRSRPGGKIHVDGDFVLRHGSVVGLDLVEAVRRGATAPVRGGRTRFDQLAGKLVWDGALLRLSELDGGSGALRATGALTVGRGARLSGSFQVGLKGSTTELRMPVAVSGTLKEPELQGGQR